QALVACAMMNCNMECFPPPPPPPPPPSCDAPAMSPSGGSCIKIGGSVKCNPVTNQGCQPGEACDFGMAAFVCHPPPNDAMLCEKCSNSNPGPFCGGGMHCLEDLGLAKCAHFCCDDCDCGSGTCDLTLTGIMGLGFCTVLSADAGTNN